MGRTDSQIKLNGYRIELDDISENINKLNYVRNSVVLPTKNDEAKVESLIAVVLLKENLGLSKLKFAIQFKKDLGELVPKYMVPQKVVVVDSFPLNVNGKIDRRKLMEVVKGDH